MGVLSSFSRPRLKVLNRVFAPLQRETKELRDLCQNISLSLTTPEKCPLQPPQRAAWPAGAPVAHLPDSSQGRREAACQRLGQMLATAVEQ